ncbi:MULTISPECIES: LacI family DNA-binding transcriptional regulator [Paenibacillus]|uniref:LacI family DNA-binding transcriptional regulator n=1 Tax=Paenibacillus TaxID=44249 RepID=UPI0022B873BD|nr:LacI family DNA-binding transcriptional regulator [Paenibacillus caseinilyticus]MCZ8523441.1 LacI family DNA-binding transcriptional regulator [Paenibacillus caseinilyticus]
MANIKEIAKLSGVSVSTVSRVLNGHPYVAEDKRQAVQDTVRRLNYSRNLNAVQLIKGRTGMIGVILPYIHHPYFMMLLEGIAREALQEGVQLVLCQSNYRAEEETAMLERLRMKGLDGVILCSRALGWEALEAYSDYGPLVVCDQPGSPLISSVYIDHYRCFREAMDYLNRRGHRRIGFSLGRGDSASSRERRRAYADVLEGWGEPLREDWVLPGCFTLEDGAELIRRVLAMEERPTAMIVTGDEVAVGFMTEAGRQDVAIPGDLALMGFDNQPISRMFALTTIDNGLTEMGRTAFSILHGRIQGEQAVVHRELPFTIVERSTV